MIARHAHRTAGSIDHLMRDAAEKHLAQRRATVRADHNQIGEPLIGFGDDFAARRSESRFSLDFPTGEELMYL